MDKLPKRRKFKDNPYSLLIEENKYFIIFKDNKNILHKERVNKDVFDVFDEYERYDNAKLKEYSIHLEHSKQTDISIYKRSNTKPYDIEEHIMKTNLLNNLKNAIDTLPEIQKRRLIKYYFYNMTFDEIAKEEKCTKRAVKFSVDIAVKKLYEYLKLYN